MKHKKHIIYLLIGIGIVILWQQHKKTKTAVQNGLVRDPNSGEWVNM